MVLMSCTLGFNIFTIFNFYMKTNEKISSYILRTDIALSILWSAIYTLPAFTVIFIGASLKRKVFNRKCFEQRFFVMYGFLY